MVKCADGHSILAILKHLPRFRKVGESRRELYLISIIVLVLGSLKYSQSFVHAFVSLKLEGHLSGQTFLMRRHNEIQLVAFLTLSQAQLP